MIHWPGFTGREVRITALEVMNALYLGPGLLKAATSGWVLQDNGTALPLDAPARGDQLLP